MDKLTITGGRSLYGEVNISGAKNSALAILVAAGLAAKGETVLENVPHGKDVDSICTILSHLGICVWRDSADLVHVRADSLCRTQAPYDLGRRLRASFYCAGLLLARVGKAEVPMPGGCDIGSRPVDFHIKGFTDLGAEVTIEHGYVKAVCTTLQGTNIYINRSSVGTTMNLMMAASLAEGVTTLENAAKEPEVVDLAIFLNGMGARIRGAGTDIIRIDGAKELHGIEYSVIPDRIEAGTFLMAAAMTRGNCVLQNIVLEHLRSPIRKLEEAGAVITKNTTALQIQVPERLRAIDVETAPYPGYPTDLQQPLVAVLTLAEGTSVIRETIFDRFRYVDELRRMGADIKVERETAIVRGVNRLTGAAVEVTDLRAGAALAIAAMAAEGETELTGVESIDRGYENFDGKLRSLGADVVRETVADAD